MGFTETGDPGGIKSASCVQFEKRLLIKKRENVAQMTGITGRIQLLYPAHGFPGQGYGLGMDQWPVFAACFEGIELPAAEWPLLIDQAGVIMLEKRTDRSLVCLFVLPVLCDLPLDPLVCFALKGLDLLFDDPALQGGDIQMAEMGTAIGAAGSADSLCSKPRPVFVVLPVNLQKLLAFLPEVHALHWDCVVRSPGHVKKISESERQSAASIIPGVSANF